MTSNALSYKFLARGAKGPFSGFEWPVPDAGKPGSWVEAVGPLSLCSSGLHVCSREDLAYWLHDELWELETAGDEIAGLDCRVVRRARLARRIEVWGAGGASRFGAACIGHATALAGHDPSASRATLEDAQQAARAGYIAVAAFMAAVAVAKQSGTVATDAFRRERSWQSEWIARELIDAGR